MIYVLSMLSVRLPATYVIPLLVQLVVSFKLADGGIRQDIVLYH